MTRNIGERIHALRKEKGMTQERLAEALGVSAQAVSRWESGGYPAIDLLPAIADLFGVTTDLLLGVPAARREKELEKLLLDLYEESQKTPFDLEKICRILREIRLSHAREPSARLLLLCILPRADCLRSEKVLPELRAAIDAILRQSTGTLREHMILSMALWEEDAHFEDLLRRYATPGDLSEKRLRMLRARNHGDLDTYDPLWQAHIFENLQELLDPSGWHPRTFPKNSEKARIVYQTQAKLFALLSGDAWDETHPVSGCGRVDCLAGERLYFGVSYAAFLAFAGENDRALLVLEDTVSYLGEILERIKRESAPLSLDPLLLLPEFSARVTLCPAPGEEGAWMLVCDDGTALPHSMVGAAWLLELLNGMENFAPLHGDSRFESCVDRLRGWCTSQEV